MARPSREPSIDTILREVVEGVVDRVSAAISRQIGALVQQGVREQLSGRARGGRPAGRKPRGEITRWVADARARRVPNFVIDATGLDTKKKIVARFGVGAAFEKGKPLPKAKAAA